MLSYSNKNEKIFSQIKKFLSTAGFNSSLSDSRGVHHFSKLGGVSL
jgi:hypothetical protein